MLADIYLALTSLKMISNHKGKVIVLTPDDLYNRFIDLVIFPRHDLLHALPSELQKAVQLERYVLSDLFLLTFHLEEQELQRLREWAVVAHKTLQDESKRIIKLMTTFGTIRGSNSLAA